MPKIDGFDRTGPMRSVGQPVGPVLDRQADLLAGSLLQTPEPVSDFKAQILSIDDAIEMPFVGQPL